MNVARVPGLSARGRYTGAGPPAALPRSGNPKGGGGAGASREERFFASRHSDAVLRDLIQGQARPFPRHRVSPHRQADLRGRFDRNRRRARSSARSKELMERIITSRRIDSPRLIEDTIEGWEIYGARFWATTSPDFLPRSSSTWFEAARRHPKIDGKEGRGTRTRSTTAFDQVPPPAETSTRDTSTPVGTRRCGYRREACDATARGRLAATREGRSNHRGNPNPWLSTAPSSRWRARQGRAGTYHQLICRDRGLAEPGIAWPGKPSLSPSYPIPRALAPSHRWGERGGEGGKESPRRKELDMKRILAFASTLRPGFRKRRHRRRVAGSRCPTRGRVDGKTLK